MSDGRNHNIDRVRAAYQKYLELPTVIDNPTPEHHADRSYYVGFLASNVGFLLDEISQLQAEVDGLRKIHHITG